MWVAPPSGSARGLQPNQTTTFPTGRLGGTSRATPTATFGSISDQVALSTEPWGEESPMSVRRLEHIPGFNIDRVAAAAGDDPEVLRMENLDTDIPPPAAALEATRGAIGEDDANSWLPFTGRGDPKEAVAEYIERHGGPR